jgi:hypothetical protein
MSKILHLVKEPEGRFQVRTTESAGEGHGQGGYVECKDWQEVKSELRGQGCTNAQIEGALKQLEEADNAEIRF